MSLKTIQPEELRPGDVLLTAAQAKTITDAAADLRLWTNGPMTIESNAATRLHRLFEASREDRLLEAGSLEDAKSLSDVEEMFKGYQAFVISHDWHGALGDALGKIGNDDFKMPFPACVFEFRCSGKNVVVFYHEQPDGSYKVGHFTEHSSGYWLCMDSDLPTRMRLSKVFDDQVKAVCIALDAEVAARDVVRAPHALNAKRLKNGKPLLSDYHVVSLSKRHRVKAGGGAATGRHPRLHFRRGHWRHFEDHKTWINWMLVGNPDLGFIAKHYSL